VWLELVHCDDVLPPTLHRRRKLRRRGGRYCRWALGHVGHFPFSFTDPQSSFRAAVHGGPGRFRLPIWLEGGYACAAASCLAAALMILILLRMWRCRFGTFNFVVILYRLPRCST
jgi:hypothetical protein